MIRLIVNNTELRLPEKFELPLELNNPGMIDDIVLGDYSYPAEIPFDTDGVNRKALGFPDQTENNEPLSSTLSATLFIGNKSLYGLLRIIRVTNKSVNISFSSALGIVKDTLAGKKIADYIYSDIILANVNKWIVLTVTIANPTANCSVTLHLNNIVYAANYNYTTYGAGAKSQMVQDLCTAINNDAASGCSATYDGGTLDITLTSTGVGPENAFSSKDILTSTSDFTWAFALDELNWMYSHCDAVKTALNAAAAADADSCAYTLFPVQNPGFYDQDRNTNFGGIVNYYRNYLGGGGFLLNGKTNVFDVLTYNEYCISPYIYLKTVLDAIFADLPFEVKSDFLDNAEIKSLSFYNNVSIDAGDYFVSISSPGIINLYRSRFNPKDFLPDMLASDLLNALRTLYNLHIWFDVNTNSLRIEPNAISDNGAKAINITDKAAGEGEMEPPLTNGYTLTFSLDENDKAVSEATGFFKDYIVGGGETQINTAFSSLLMVDYVDSLYDRTITIPYANQSGVSDIFPVEGDPPSFTPRLLFYRGMQNDSGGASGVNIYPMGSSDVYDVAGTVQWNYALTWSGDYGLYRLFYATWLSLFMSSRLLRIQALLTPADIVNIDYLVPFMFKASLYVLTKLNVTVRPFSLSSATLEMYRIPAP